MCSTCMLYAKPLSGTIFITSTSVKKSKANRCELYILEKIIEQSEDNKSLLINKSLFSVKIDIVIFPPRFP